VIVDLEVLQKTFATITELITARGHSTLDIREDYFWHIPRDERYRLEEDPDSFTVGRLKDSYEFVERIARGDSDPIPFGLVWLADLLREIGETEL
jgi:hypothetical protein